MAMLAISLASYDQEFSYTTFQALEGPDEAYEKVSRARGDVIGLLRDIFLKYEVEDIAGLCLLHRHFDLQAMVSSSSLKNRNFDVPDSIKSTNAMYDRQSKTS